MKLPLKKMSIREKLAVMEALWEDLAREPEQIASPDWHKRTLDERRKRVAKGEARFTDWNTAKEKIRRKVS
jgi:hypothetical protein